MQQFEDDARSMSRCWLGAVSMSRCWLGAVLLVQLLALLSLALPIKATPRSLMLLVLSDIIDGLLVDRHDAVRLVLKHGNIGVHCSSIGTKYHASLLSSPFITVARVL